MYRLSVPTRRVVTTMPVNKVQTAPAEWVIGHLPASSALHAVNLCWNHLPHRKAALLDQEGRPLAHGPMKRREIVAREVKVEGANPRLCADGGSPE